MQKFIPVVCGIIECNEMVLAAKRNKKQSNAGLWEFPGGKIDPGELPVDALKRELFEELGIMVAVYNQIQAVNYEYPWIAIELIPFVCKINSGVPFAHEHEEVRFFTIKELDLLDWAPADLQVIDCYLKHRMISK